MERRSKVDIDSASYRKDLWEKEYSSTKGLLSSNTVNPSSSLREFLKNYKGKTDLAIDIGSGNGRNSIYLSKFGFKKVIAVELSNKAVLLAKKLFSDQGISNIYIINESVSNSLPLNNEANLIIDMMTLHTLREIDVANYSKYIQESLVVGGFYLLFTISDKSKETHEDYPELHFSVHKLEKTFPTLKLIKSEEFPFKTKVKDRVLHRYYLKAIFQKI